MMSHMGLISSIQARQGWENRPPRTFMDWSPRSRTSNPRSRSPAVIPQPVDYGKRFAAGWVRERLEERIGAVEGQ